jgi:hypothetical protein
VRKGKPRTNANIQDSLDVLAGEIDRRAKATRDCASEAKN